MILPDSLRAHLPTGDAFAHHLSRVARSSAVEKLEPAFEGPTLVVALPQFAYTAFGATRTLNRIQWGAARVIATDQVEPSIANVSDAGSPVVLAPAGTEVAVEWRVGDTAAGDSTGRVTIDRLGKLSGMPTGIPDGQLPTVHECVTSRSLARELERISEDGRSSLFELAMALTSYTESVVASAGRRVHREIHSLPSGDEQKTLGGHSVIDELEVEQIAARVLWGEPGSTTSVTTRLIRRVASTDAVVRKSLSKFVALALWSAAETNVRSHIGDPHAGRAIRRVAKLIRSTDPTLVLDAYRDAHPGTDVGIMRVASALSAGETVASRQVGIETVQVAS